jgi:hypothetical protein
MANAPHHVADSAFACSRGSPGANGGKRLHIHGAACAPTRARQLVVRGIVAAVAVSPEDGYYILLIANSFVGSRAALRLYTSIGTSR